MGRFGAVPACLMCSWVTTGSSRGLTQAAGDEGYQPASRAAGPCVPTYRAETEPKTHEARDHMMWQFSKGLKVLDYHLLPPGYMSGQSLRGMIMGKRKFGIKDDTNLSCQDLPDEQYIIVGTPMQVAENLVFHTKDLGAGIHIASSAQVGDMPNWKV